MQTGPTKIEGLLYDLITTIYRFIKGLAFSFFLIGIKYKKNIPFQKRFISPLIFLTISIAVCILLISYDQSGVSHINNPVKVINQVFFSLLSGSKSISVLEIIIRSIILLWIVYMFSLIQGKLIKGNAYQTRYILLFYQSYSLSSQIILFCFLILILRVFTNPTSYIFWLFSIPTGLIYSISNSVKTSLLFKLKLLPTIFYIISGILLLFCSYFLVNSNEIILSMI